MYSPVSRKSVRLGLLVFPVLFLASMWSAWPHRPPPQLNFFFVILLIGSIRLHQNSPLPPLLADVQKTPKSANLTKRQLAAIFSVLLAYVAILVIACNKLPIETFETFYLDSSAFCSSLACCYGALWIPGFTATKQNNVTANPAV
jgi:hypothetical protein